ncbi:MAG: choice-of-anchor D domain-containing protein [Planctomycetes bacterium]|nr:choice-of-anchor D domain-containing protein [Planctomycetota bacterium]MCW8136588.1 choice-of-anchor D domain-containing protein [Planctomycetota bacterium]
MRPALIALVLFAAGLAAQDSGDAPASYGLLYSYMGTASGLSLGTQISDDASNPVGRPWTGDDDDGIVGTPYWDPWSDQNTLTVNVQGPGWLIMWVDANDDGQWTADERYRYSTLYVEGPGDFTFTGITLRATQSYSYNRPNKIAVRITIQDNWGANPKLTPNGYFFAGEVEDWLIDVAPVSLAVADLSLPEAIEGKPYQHALGAVHNAGAVTWSLVGGTLPAGLALSQQGGSYVLSGTPAAGAGFGSPLYSLTFEVTDAAQNVATRTLELRVMSPATAAPFLDTFSTDKGWVLGPTWSRSPATYYVGGGSNFVGELTTEPDTDHTPGTTDNMILADSIGSHFVYQGFMAQPLYAVSPIIDCSALSSVTLRFRRWLSTLVMSGYGNSLDRAVIEVSNDGVNWSLVWKPSMNTAQINMNAKSLVDVGWTRCDYDISAIAAGQPRVQVRFVIGPAIDGTIINTGVTPMPDDYAGWSIDDVQVMQTPADALQVSAFDVQTTGSSVNPISQVTYPLLYRNSTHNWTAQVHNPGAVPLTISGFEVGATVPVQAGAGSFDTPGYEMHRSWYDVGVWAANLPLVVPAGASVQVSGTLDCVGVSAFRLGNNFELRLYLTGGMSGGGTFESSAPFECVFSNSNQPGLEVWEGQTGSSGMNQVHNGAGPFALRNYGTVLVGSSSAWTTFICKTTTSNQFTVDSPSFNGADPGEFEFYWVTPWDDTPVQGQNNVWFRVRFKPTSPGIKNATVVFHHTAGNTADPFVFNVQGVAVSSGPALRVLDAAGTAVISHTDTLDFANVDIHGPAVTRTIRIENHGNQDLVLSQIPSIVGDAAFTLDTSATQLTVAAAGFTTFEVRFDPTQIGARGATVSIPHNDPGAASPFEIQFTGFGIINAPILRVSLDGPGGPMLASGGAIQFAPRDVAAGASLPRDVFINNDGWQPLALGALPAFSGGQIGEFGIDTGLTTLVVAPHSYTIVSVWFDPVAKGLKAADIAFTHNDSQAAGPFTFAVTGYGEDPNGVVVTSGILPSAQVGQLYSHALQVAGGTGPHTWALISGNLPLGLTLQSDGTLAGTPDAPHALFNFRVRVTDALGGTDERMLELAVAPPVGHIEKGGSNEGGAGCVAGNAGAAWLVVLLALARRRRRR